MWSARWRGNFNYAGYKSEAAYFHKIDDKIQLRESIHWLYAVGDDQVEKICMGLVGRPTS